MVKSIRVLEQSLGDDKKVYEKEKQIRKWAHRSIVSIKDIKKSNYYSKRYMVKKARYRYSIKIYE